MTVDARGEIHDDARSRAQAAEAARAGLAAAQARVGVLDRIAGALGVRTAAVRDVEAAREVADRADAGRPDRRDLDERVARSDQALRALGTARQREIAEFERLPAVAAARREVRADHLVREALAVGDPAVTAVAAHDLVAARAIVLRREAEIRAGAEALVRPGLPASGRRRP